MHEICIILPSLNPDKKMIKVVEALIANAFTNILIINDGSDENHLEPFNHLSKYKECTVLTHEVNQGKGCALKTGFTHVLKHMQNCKGVITIDGDGQHTVTDILACANAFLSAQNTVVLGARNFNNENIPPRSRFGNKLTAFLFRFAFGLALSDTQTGLRAIPYTLLKPLCSVKGERFEYETNMLLFFKKANVKIYEQNISTVYIEDNKTSHFNPIVDSIRIYAIIFKFFFSSISSSLLDIGIFTVLNIFLGSVFARGSRLLYATIISRIFSAIFNYGINHKFVFQSDSPAPKTLLRYTILCIAQMLVSYALVFMISLISSTFVAFDSIIKIVVDSLLFFISFRIQQNWVFNGEEKIQKNL